MTNPSPLAGEGGARAEGVGGRGGVRLIWRQMLAIVASSFVTALATFVLIVMWSAFDRGELNFHSLGRDLVFMMMVGVPIAATGVTVFGLPLMFIVRRVGWISTILRLNLFGLVVGAIWAIIVGLLLNFRLEFLWFTALMGGVNGLLVVWLWLNIVDKFRASQRHQNLVGEAC